MQPGVVVRSDDLETATDLAASIWLIKNRGLPDEQVEPLPPGVTNDDILRAIRRQQLRRDINRRAIDAHKEALSTALPVRAYLCAGGCNRSLPMPGLCAKCPEPAVLLVDREAKPPRLTFRQFVALAALIAFVVVFLCTYAGLYLGGLR